MTNGSTNGRHFARLQVVPARDFAVAVVTNQGGNVFLSSKDLPDGQWRLLAMDHTHCFDGPGYLNAKLSRIDLVKEDQQVDLAGRA